MRILLAALLLAHGVAHLPGFLVSWRLGSFAELPYRTTILAGTFDVGDGGTKVLGAAWLALSVLFVAAAAATLLRTSWWPPLVYLSVGWSTVMCVLGWPDARIGLVANAVILAFVAVGMRAEATASP